MEAIHFASERDELRAKELAATFLDVSFTTRAGDPATLHLCGADGVQELQQLDIRFSMLRAAELDHAVGAGASSLYERIAKHPAWSTRLGASVLPAGHIEARFIVPSEIGTDVVRCIEQHGGRCSTVQSFEVRQPECHRDGTFVAGGRSTLTLLQFAIERTQFDSLSAALTRPDGSPVPGLQVIRDPLGPRREHIRLQLRLE